MKAFLMYQDRDFDMQQDLPDNAQTLIQDLELTTLFDAMALEDPFLSAVAKKAVLLSLTDSKTILYRQDILDDCLKNSSIVKEIYNIAENAMEKEKKNGFGFFCRYPGGILHRSIDVMQLFVEELKKIKNIAEVYADNFLSDGFATLFAMLKEELSEEYFSLVEAHLKELKFDNGVLISAGLGEGNKGVNYVLRKLADKQQNWWQRFFTKKDTKFTIRISERDESGFRALSELNDRGINPVANALAQSTDHILSFFTMLKTELAFYIGCMNLHDRVRELEEPMTFPVPLKPGEPTCYFRNLYDVCLTLSMKQKVVGNDVAADNKDFVIVTGANQGGKSTFLRSIGLSQLMMQCGMFVPAEAYCAPLCNGLFTHYKREEDADMNSGKFDEELSRMSDIVDHLTAHCLVLFNESFAATNEREGAEIARQIVCALLERKIKVIFVTHMFAFAHGFTNGKTDNILFLRAERQNDGERTFKIVEGEPLETSYGQDLYNRIFVSKE